MTDQTLEDAESALSEAEERARLAVARYSVESTRRVMTAAILAIRDRRLATERLAQVRRDAERRVGA